ncbi:phosphoribosylanthranilate isomerase [Bacillus carboniphilus]|uniref:N-(5'-phosphoribosyl)anthranilate isomerase n=1 Tax=Bacillus carboniphilus TaxID=86663 RepID=A0ABN0W8S5_9BACI
MKVKICGITDIQTARAAVQSGADAIGFVFAESKRKVDIDTAVRISEQVPPQVLKVGVFVNETIEKMEEIAEQCHLDFLQLHGDETPEVCKKLRYPIIKAFGIQSKEDLEEVKKYPVDYVLLDSPKGKYRGGNGITFDWNMLKNTCLPQKVVVAGGLHEDNVLDMIQKVSPDMVDVSSGVETDGKKDTVKIQRFIEKVRLSEESF